ncbi:MAG: ion channel [Alphaproteobacteria bacterium]
MVTSVIVVGLTLIVHYEALRLASSALPKLPLPLRLRVLFVVFAAFLAHTIEVWLYAATYYVFVRVLGLGAFGGLQINDWHDYVYFSAITYTSLGLGDVFPLGQVRLITGVEALNGLLLIGWSASFTYLTMEKFWPLHVKGGAKK